MKDFLLALFFTIIITSAANAQSTLALQEKCAEGAKKYFADHIEIGRGAIINNISYYSDELCISTLTYNSHYNKKSDKCFIRIDHHLSPRPKYRDTDADIHSIGLFNVFEEGKQYGDFFETRDARRLELIQRTC